MAEIAQNLFFNSITYFDNNTYGIFIFITTCTCLLMIGFPSWLITVACGCIYGVINGFIILLICIFLSEMLVYIIGFWTSLIQIPFLHNKKTPKVINYLNEIATSDHIFILLILLKLNPLVPFIPITFYLGIRKFPYLLLLLSSLIGSVPFGLLWTFLGNNLHDIAVLTTLSKKDLLGNYEFLYLTASLVLTIAAIFFVLRIISKRK